ncbi:MAG: 2-oxoglutarate dehydrogenase E1 component [Abitibacteriaceae bacterium]|nr:2-oxoglutarate dehydrogenase E1 component [Abditibacteriaceae bacterium]
MSETGQLPGSLNLAFVEELYAQYMRDAASVPNEWREYFASLSPQPTRSGNGEQAEEFHLGPSFRPSSVFNPAGSNGATYTNGASHTNGSAYRNGSHGSATANGVSTNGTGAKVDAQEVDKATALQDRVDQLIRAYRVRGHMIARLDPLGLPRPHPPELNPAFYGFTAEDMERHFSCETLHCEGTLPLRDIISHLHNTYCRFIGVQFMHIDALTVRNWLQERMEMTQNRIELGREEQIRILTRLTDAVTFEEFIRRKYVNAKSFSLKGAESLVPLLDLAIEKAAEQDIDEIVMAMAHRGRLNVLANIIGKSPREIFREFEDADPDLHVGGGDVKYHLGYNNDWETATGRKVHLALCFNPSHLEFVDPVALGRMRAKQDRAGDLQRRRGMVLMIHGDAAFAGEGVIQEILNMSQLKGYSVGGTLHVIVNNQVGFTTSPKEGRSSPYASDVAKMLQIPIFHVNGEEPEAVAQVVKLALDFRQAFKRDVVIDMYCYRRLGHNESDEPSFTQPAMYRAIEQRKPVREAYLEHLLKLGGMTAEEADEIAEHRSSQLEKELTEARSESYHPPNKLRDTGGYQGGPESQTEDVPTGVAKERLSSLLEIQTHPPQGFQVHPKIERLLQARRAMAAGERPLDWSNAEALAFASLAVEGVRIRLTGQDSERGTFSQRHAVLHDVVDDHTYMPLQNLSADQAPVEIYNSPLSETGVLGFEYGYSLDSLSSLTLWEAQFGDFWNVAQVIVDQFISSAEDKWHHLSGLVLLLPHGFEGMGPEHSSARLERFLELAAEDNIQVVYPTTPAQYFHLLRRQVLRKWRKPLVVMSPKSLLRHLEAVSTLDELAQGAFQRIIPDVSHTDGKDIKRILLCTGKIYYELDKQRESLKRDDVAILRLEQLYPLSHQVLQSALAPYPDGTPVYWVQEEPENMGAWRYMRVQFGDKLFGRLPFAGVYRPASASPATGSASSHKKEQEQILAEAFGGG